MKHALTPFGVRVKKKLIDMGNKSNGWLAEQVRNRGIACHEQQLSRCLRGITPSTNIKKAICEILQIEE